MQAISTVSTLKQQRDQSKMAKKLKKLERDAKNNGKKSREVLGLQHLQIQRNRQRLVYFKGTDCTEAEIQAERERDKKAFEDMVYYRNLPEAISYFETIIRGSRLIGLILQYINPSCCKDLIENSNLGENAMKKWGQVYDMSPNQRRQVLSSLMFLCDLVRIYQSALSQETFNAIKSVNTAIQVAAYFLKIYESDPVLSRAMFRVINGESSRKIASELGLKELDLKLKILNIAKYLFRIGQAITECDGIKPAYSIPCLRAKQYRYLGDFQFLANFSADFVFKVLKPFRLEYGIDILDLPKYELKVVQIQKKVFLGV